MHITDHAIRKYKRRFGQKSTSADRAKKQIRSALNKELICVLSDPVAGDKFVCKDFVAVVRDNTVITIHDGRKLPKHVRTKMFTSA